MRITKENLIKYWPVLFFVGGFLFDILTTDRIDQSFGLWMQMAYLSIASIIVFCNLRQPKWWEFPNALVSFLKKYSDEAVHFCFGSLFSVYTIFYFKSASLINSFLFMMVLISLLLINELPKLQKLGGPVKVTLLAVCWMSYFIYLVPILTGSIGLLSFLLSITLGAGLNSLILVLAHRNSRLESYNLQKDGIFPTLGVALVFCILYFTKVLPPVPLALKDIGVYHAIKKEAGDYNLKYEKANWWRFWESSAQTFLARPGDRVNVFVQVFSPTAFKEKLSINWYNKTQGKWKKRDSIPIAISGGRDEGFRGYSYKQNYETGLWQVRISTSDQRELGRLSFSIRKAPESSERQWTIVTK